MKALRSEKHAHGERCADIWAFGFVLALSQTLPRALGGSLERQGGVRGLPRRFFGVLGKLWERAEAPYRQK